MIALDLVLGQDPVDLTTDDAWLDGDLTAIALRVPCRSAGQSKPLCAARKHSKLPLFETGHSSKQRARDRGISFSPREGERLRVKTATSAQLHIWNKQSYSNLRAPETYMYGVVPEGLAVMTELQEDGVCESLPRQRGACCSEGHWDFVLVRYGQDAGDFCLVLDLDDHPRIQPVEGGICAIGEGPDCVCELPLGVHKGRHLLGERSVSAILEALTVHIVVCVGSEVRVAL